MSERLMDECALCRAKIWVKPRGLFHQEDFCAQCRIAESLEKIVELLEERHDAWH